MSEAISPVRSEVCDLGEVFEPAGGDPRPGIVLIHDVWGLQDHTRDVSKRLAAEGFAVLAIDLYRRTPEAAIENPGEWMRGLSDPQVLDDLQAGADWLAGRGAPRVAVVGFCMGGMYALMAGAACSGLSAVVPFYGILSHRHGLLFSEDGLDPAKKPREPLEWAAELRCPLLGFFGGRDDFIPEGDVAELRERLDRSGAPHDVRVYPEAGHAFFNDTREDAYCPEDAADAWRRMLAFLGGELATQ